MHNPFIYYDEQKKTEYIDHTCSVNRVRIAKLPVRGVEDGIEGMRANQIFSAKLLSEEILSSAKRMHVELPNYSFRELPRFLSEAVLSDDILSRRLATAVTTKFGNRLGLILLTLKSGLKENREARDDWKDEHWEYWANIKDVILTGGLASGLMGKRFKEQVHYVFDVAGVKPYNLYLYENSSHIGAMGCSRIISESDKTFAVLDFGQTNIKRCIIKKRGGELASISTLNTVPSMNMDLTFRNTQENYNRAMELHRYLINVVCDSCKSLELEEGEQGEVIISIANYAIGGELNPNRGGYAKLHLISENYAELLSHELSSRMHRPYRVRLVHDGTANALNFAGKEDAVCLSIGTAFGVGFPQIKLGY